MCGCGALAPIARQTNAEFGYIEGHPVRFVAGHNNRGNTRDRYRVEERGYSTPCWTWLLFTDPAGYGSVGISGRSVLAHRWVYERERAPIPAGLELDHLCRHRDCVNPDHLQVVNGAENARRGANAKLTYGAVDEIRELRLSGRTQREVAACFGVSRATIGDIDCGRTWAVPGVAL